MTTPTATLFARLLALAFVVPLCACGDDAPTGPARDQSAETVRQDAGPGADGPTGGDSRPNDARPPDGKASDAAPGGWELVYHEDFESLTLPAISWTADPVPDDGPFSDHGLFFQGEGVTPPSAFRATQTIGKDGWLTVESYTRSASTQLVGGLLSVVADPAGGGNKVLRLRSIAHTDATVLRPTQALPPRYRVTVRVGYASFGTGAGNNGYSSGNESAGPWRPGTAISDNGFYWLAVLDAPPRPHNNVWIHHHRKVVIDSDNHYPPWMEVWNGSTFVNSGVHPVMMFALDGASTPSPWVGHDFISWSAGAWQPSGEIRAPDAYKEKTWYTAVIERDGANYTLRISGDFQYGGQASYGGTIDAANRCVFHYNRSAAELDAGCVVNTFFSQLGASHPHWPAGSAYPDYFMFGDPHVNYYEGTVYYDDVKLEVKR